MPLNEIFSKSFEDYKKNFKIVLKGSLLLDFLPYLVSLLLLFIIVMYSLDSLTPSLNTLETAFENAVSFKSFLLTLWELVKVLLPLILVGVVLIIICSILSFLLTLTLHYASLYNKGKLSFSEAFKQSSSYFWKGFGYKILLYLVFLGLVIISSILIFLTVLLWSLIPTFLKVLFVLLCILMFTLTIILIIYLSISWIFSLFIIIYEKKGVIDSMKSSRKLVKGRWWLTLGYVALIGLITGGIAWMVNLFSGLFQSLIEMSVMFSADPTSKIIASFLKETVGAVFALALALTVVPFVIFFYKNIYLEYKASVEDKKKTKK